MLGMLHIHKLKRQLAVHMIRGRTDVDPDNESDPVTTNNGTGISQAVCSNDVVPVYLSSYAPVTLILERNKAQLIVVNDALIKFAATPKKLDIVNFSKFCLYGIESLCSE